MKLVDDHKPLRKWKQNIVVLAYLIFLGGLGVRGLILQDTRFAWGMFSHQTHYVVKYYQIGEDGTRRECDIGKGLKGKARRINDRNRAHTTRYGVGAVRCWIQSYLRHLSQHLPANDGICVNAELLYSVDFGEWKLETINDPLWQREE